MNSNDLVKSTAATKPLSGLAARKAAANTLALAKGETPTAKVIELTPDNATDRIGIGFDDSGSMSGRKMSDAHAGVEEFLRSCNKDTTAISVYPFNDKPILLSTQLPAIALMVKNIQATGGTPLVSTCMRMINANNLTRAIVFSDGQYGENDESLISLAKRKHCPIDTIFIAASATDNSGVARLENLAEQTGGIFLRFETGRSNFRTAFKYLAPVYRAQLMAPGFKEKLENGEL